MFSVDTEEEAKSLIVLACGRDDAGNYYAKELVEDQTLDNLAAFSDRLAKAWEFLKKAKKKGAAHV